MAAFADLINEGKIEKAIELLPQAESKKDALGYSRLYRHAARFCMKKEPTSAREIARFDAGEGKRITAAALHPYGRGMAIGVEKTGVRAGAGSGSGSGLETGSDAGSEAGLGADLVLLDDFLQVIGHRDVLGPERDKKVVEKLGLWGQDEREHALGDDQFLSVDFSRTGRLMMCRMKHSLQIWEGNSVTCLQWPAEIDVPGRCAVLTADENMVLVNDNRKVIFKLWDLRTGEVYENINNRENLPFCSDMLCYHDGVSVITIDRQGKLREFDDTAAPCSYYENTGLNGELRLFMTPDRQNLYILSSEGVDIWDWTGRKKTGHLSAPLSSAACISPDGTLLAAAHGENVGVWSVRDQKLLFEISAPGEPAADKLIFSADGCVLCICRGAQVSLQLLDRELVFPGWSDWDEKADPLYDAFQKRCGNSLSLDDARDLIWELQCFGFGYIRREAAVQKVRSALEKRKESEDLDRFIDQVREESKADLPAEEKAKLEKNKKTVRDFIGRLILGAVLAVAGAAGFVFSFVLAAHGGRMGAVIAVVLAASAVATVAIMLITDCWKQIKVR